MRLRCVAAHRQRQENQSGITRLLQIVGRETEVRQWRDTLTDNQRWEWPSPSAIFKHCPLFAKPKSNATPSRTFKPRLEVALDAVDEHLHDMDEDGRRATLERIVGRYGYRLEALPDQPDDGASAN